MFDTKSSCKSSVLWVLLDQVTWKSLYSDDREKTDVSVLMSANFIWRNIFQVTSKKPCQKWIRFIKADSLKFFAEFFLGIFVRVSYLRLRTIDAACFWENEVLSHQTVDERIVEMHHVIVRQRAFFLGVERWQEIFEVVQLNRRAVCNWLQNYYFIYFLTYLKPQTKGWNLFFFRKVE